MRATIAFVILLPACAMYAPKYKLTATGAVGVAKPASCDFIIATTKVDRPYDEIAILDCDANKAGDVAAFKESVRTQVCGIGGDAVIAEVNGYGSYVRGTVLKWKDAETAK
jgi:hypothetical protein